MTGVSNAVRTGIQAALRVIQNIASSFFNAGKNIVNSIVDGIKSVAGKVKDAVTGIVDGARNLLPFSPAKEGPLKDIHKLNFAGPIVSSIERDQDAIQKALQNALALPDTEGFDIAGQIDSTNRSMQLDVERGRNRVGSRSDDEHVSSSGTQENTTNLYFNDNDLTPSVVARKVKQTNRQLGMGARL